MTDKEKGEMMPKGHAAAVKEAIEDHKAHHIPHISMNGGTTGPAVRDSEPEHGSVPREWAGREYRIDDRCFSGVYQSDLVAGYLSVPAAARKDVRNGGLCPTAQG